MFEDLTIVFNDGILEWLEMSFSVLSSNYGFVGAGVLLLPVLRRLVRIFNHSI